MRDGTETTVLRVSHTEATRFDPSTISASSCILAGAGGHAAHDDFEPDSGLLACSFLFLPETGRMDREIEVSALHSFSWYLGREGMLCSLRSDTICF